MGDVLLMVKYIVVQKQQQPYVKATPWMWRSLWR